jgi:hypothetical protein
MATVKRNGGAASVWEQKNGLRIVLCHNGKALISAGPGCGFYHATGRLAALLAGKPLAEQESALAALGCRLHERSTQIAAATTVAAYAHQNEKRSRALRRRVERLS